MFNEPNAPAAKMDAADLWREEVFTDRKLGAIRRLTPVRPDGAADPARHVLFVGEASLLTPAGSLPLSFEIPAATLEQAVAAYGDEVARAFDEAMAELKEMRRRASSSLVLPQGGLPPGGLGGPGGLAAKLKLP